MQNVRSAVIAAAGMGSRIGLGIPKCMINIHGKTILTRLIETLQQHVSQIYVVIGYREDMVIEYCAKHHRDVVIVRNPDYRTTNTAFSFAKGAQTLDGKVLFLDGDLVIEPESLAQFISTANQQDILVGITESKSENAVYAHGTMHPDQLFDLTHFSREEKGHYEWANIVSGPAQLLKDANSYVYERLEEHLPLKGHLISLSEVDTAADLDITTAFVKTLDQ